MSVKMFFEITPWGLGANIIQEPALLGHFHSSLLILTFNPKACSAWGPTLMAKKNKLSL